MIGKTLGHYEITSQLGKGGMGEVYRAKDSKLGRDVAIKVLPEEFARDADRVARFQREAKLLASLNHPNIAAIYGLEESGGTNFLVLELVEGETLADQLTRGPIPVEESLKLALQIAEALEAAHENGIIHRDLKPANIKVTPDGRVKVLDFGLAKAFAGEQAEMNLSASPTLSHLATQQGIILGTAAYMSPEQAKGKTVDKRADIWAFGCVLFEMLTGQAAFQGEDITEILASVVKGGANLDLLPANIHPRVREVITRCLQKDLRRRYSSITDARYEIEQALVDPGGVLVRSITGVEPRAGMRTILPWTAAALVLGLIIAGVAFWWLKPPEPRPVLRFSYVLPENQNLLPGNVAISPDGSQFVCCTDGGLYLYSIGQLDAKLIPGTEKDQAVNPAFSPDGQWIAYYSRGSLELKKIATGGGAPMKICKLQRGGSPTWCNDNTLLVATIGGYLMRVSSDGGTPETIGEPKGGILLSGQLLPDGMNILVSLLRGGQSQIAVQSIATGNLKVLFAGAGGRYIPTGHLIYSVEDNLFAVRFDPEKLAAVGGPTSVVQGVQSAFQGLQIPRYSISNSGTLVYVPGSGSGSNRILVWVDRNGTEEAMDVPLRAYAYARLSPDGTQVALDIRDQENDIWIWSLARKTLSRLTFDPGMNRGGVWTPDGKRLAFSAERDGAENIYWQPSDGSGAPEPLTKFPKTSLAPISFSPDGKQLFFTESLPPRHINLLALDGGGAPKQLFGTKFDEQNPQISPDGRWIAYQSSESGQSEIYVRPFPNVDGGRWQISTQRGTRPLWSKNGRELFYYIEPGTMMAVPIEQGPSFKAGAPKVLFKGEYLSPQAGLQYSVTPDGQRFLMIKNAAAKPGSTPPRQQINIVMNWIEELKQRVPAK